MAKILLIDDSPSIRATFDMLLREEGYDVLLADNGWTGMECYRREHPDVILLDVNMPVLDGIAVLELIRATDLKQPVIVLTGEINPETERHVRALGVSGFIVKGQPLRALIGALEDIFKGDPSDGSRAA